MTPQRKSKTGEQLFLYKLELTDRYRNPTNWDASTTAIVEQHAAFLEELGKEGVLVFAGRTLFNPGDVNLFTIALIKTPDVETAQLLMAKDPAVVNNIQQATLLPFSLSARYFKNLDGKEKAAEKPPAT